MKLTLTDEMKSPFMNSIQAQRSSVSFDVKVVIFASVCEVGLWVDRDLFVYADSRSIGQYRYKQH